MDNVAGWRAGVAPRTGEQRSRWEGLAVTTVDENRQIAVAFYEQAFNDKQPEQAAATYMGPSYTQHNPEAANGPEAFIAFVRSLQDQHPKFHLDIKRVLAEGDLVVTHGNLHLEPGDQGLALADFFRIADGKVVEHWDVIQPVPERAANSNTMF
jgi:predicted SnoaL-like aldol condensation-catalyzing enzyme